MLSWRRTLDLNWATFQFVKFFVMSANTTMSAFLGLKITVIFIQVLHENDGLII